MFTYSVFWFHLFALKRNQSKNDNTEKKSWPYCIIYTNNEAWLLLGTERVIEKKNDKMLHYSIPKLGHLCFHCCIQWRKCYFAYFAFVYNKQNEEQYSIVKLQRTTSKLYMCCAQYENQQPSNNLTTNNHLRMLKIAISLLI